MQIKVGTDIIEVSRIQESIESMGENFINKIFTKEEIDYCKNTKKLMYQHYAARFAAKEALFKAISNKLEDKYSISWQNIEVQNDKQGRPNVEMVGKDLPGILDIDISISHCKEYAVANVVVLSE